jgi:hypothetical protein
MPFDITVHKKGDNNATVRTGGNEKQRYTVMLCIAGDGRNVPPYIVLKRKTVKSECERCDHPNPRIRLDGPGSGTKLD